MEYMNTKQKNEQNIQELWDNYKRSRIGKMGILEVEERENGAEELFELKMMGGFLKSSIMDPNRRSRKPREL